MQRNDFCVLNACLFIDSNKQNDNFTEKITRLEKLLENEKRLCGNLSAENRELKDELALLKAATASADQIKLV